MTRLTIEKIEPKTWAVSVRDRDSGKLHELELAGSGPWDLALNGNGNGASTQKREAEPPADRAITLHLDNEACSGVVQISATGPGAIAWTEAKGTLLGVKWTRHASTGAPIVVLDDYEDLAADLERALSDVTLDTTAYLPCRTAEPPEAPAESGPRSTSRGTTGRRGRRRVEEEAEFEETEEDEDEVEEADEEAEPDEEPDEEPEPARKPKARAGRGNGTAVDLDWSELAEGEHKGLVARHQKGAFKLFHLGDETHALFYQYDAGGYEKIRCGTLKECKDAARRWEPAGTIDPRGSCAEGRKDVAPDDAGITLRVVRGRAGVFVLAQGTRVHEWAFIHPRVLGATWAANAQHDPIAEVEDSPTLVADLRREFPGVQLDTSEYEPVRSPTAAPDMQHPLRRSGLRPLPAASKRILDTLTAGLASPSEPGTSARVYDAKGPFLAAHVERLDVDRFSVAHYIEQGGDRIADPDIEFIREAGEWYPAAVQLAIGRYEEAITTDEQGQPLVVKKKYNDLRPLAQTLLRNIWEQQGLGRANSPAPATSPAPKAEPAAEHVAAPAPAAPPTPAPAPQQLTPEMRQAMLDAFRGAAKDALAAQGAPA